MDTHTLTLTLQIDPEAWAKWQNETPTPAVVLDWVVEVLGVSQGAAAGAVTVRNVR